MNNNKRHAFSLSTHQFRARHVQGVWVKRLSYPACTHLRLVHPSTGTVLFRSVDYHFSSNPHWTVNSPAVLQLSLTDLIVQIWDSEANRMIIENFVTLSALCHRGEKLLENGVNTVLIQMQDSIFYYNHGKFPDVGRNVVLNEDEIKKPYCTVNSSSARVSYDTTTVLSLHDMYKSVVEARDTCSTFQQHIQTHVTVSRDLEIRCRIKDLRDRRSKMVAALQKESAVLEKLRASNQKKSEERARLRKRMRELSNELTDDLESMDWKIRYVVKSKTRLLCIQQSMFRELSDIFEISQDNKSHAMTIFGLKILAQDQICDKSDEEELGPALGYTAQLVAYLSFILAIPLRFPLNPALSLSTIRDDINAKLDEKRVLPLYIKGKDKSYFSYGVFLLHRNIAQIRHSCGLKTEEIKEPLGNLDSLLCSKLKDTISCQPPARLVNNDKIISKFKTKDTFKKTHKRVRSAPIKFTVSVDGSVGLTSYSNVPSTVSSWSSSHSLKISEGNTTSSTEDITAHKDSTDLMVFIEDEEHAASSGDFPGGIPCHDVTPHFTLDEERDTGSSCNEFHTPNSSPSDNQTQNGDISALSESLNSHITPSPSGSRAENSATVHSNLSQNPDRELPTCSHTLPYRTTPSATPNSRSSFKSYVRGSDLWGKSEGETSRTASFKSYRDLPPSGDVITSRVGGGEKEEDRGGEESVYPGEESEDITAEEEGRDPLRVEEVDTTWGDDDWDGDVTTVARSSPVISGPNSRPSSKNTSQSSELGNNRSDVVIHSTSSSSEGKSGVTTSSSSEGNCGVTASRSVSVNRPQPTHHYATKVYMALDSPIILNVPANHVTTTHNLSSRGTESAVSPLGTPSNSLPSRTVVDEDSEKFCQVVPDICPEEIFSD